MIAILLVVTHGCAKQSDESADGDATNERSTQNSEQSTKQSPPAVAAGAGRGTLFIDDAFIEFAIPDCDLDSVGKSVLGNGGSGSDTFDVTIDGASGTVVVTYADGRTITGTAPEPLQGRNNSLSGQFELAGDGQEPGIAMLFAECAR